MGFGQEEAWRVLRLLVNSYRQEYKGKDVHAYDVVYAHSQTVSRVGHDPR